MKAVESSFSFIEQESLIEIPFFQRTYFMYGEIVFMQNARKLYLNSEERFFILAYIIIFYCSCYIPVIQYNNSKSYCSYYKSSHAYVFYNKIRDLRALYLYILNTLYYQFI